MAEAAADKKVSAGGHAANSCHFRLIEEHSIQPADGRNSLKDLCPEDKEKVAKLIRQVQQSLARRQPDTVAM